MVIIGYAHTAGYTESNSLPTLLGKINPKVKWKRIFPAYDKTKMEYGPKGSTPIRLRASQNGITGQALITEIMRVFQNYSQAYQHLDGLVIADDLDCGSSVNASQLSQQIGQFLGKTIPCIILYASPEVEAWFVADWNNSFKFVYGGQVASSLFHVFSRHTPPITRSSIESFGGPAQAQGGCTYKLSSEIQATFAAGIGTTRVYQYSKRYHGNAMLANINPDTVVEVCTNHFAHAYRQIQSIP